MNLRSIEYFLVTAEEMNFTRAAERLFVSQQALSSHIKRLEDEYHAQLFARRPTLHLTLAGQQMVFYGRQILASEAKLRAAFSDLDKNCRGALTVGISRLRGDVFFPPIWNYYHPSHPNISIELVDGNSAKLDELLQTGKIDLYMGVDIPSSPNQCRIQLAREKMQCCMAQTLLEQYRPDQWREFLNEFRMGIDLTRIVDIPFITLRRNNRLRKGLEQFFAHEFSPRYAFESDQQELIYEMAKSGAGVGLASPVIFYQHMREINELGQAFHVFPVINDIPENILYLVYRKDFPLPQYAMDFIQVACMVLKTYSHTILHGGIGGTDCSQS
ncbi:LysR family transcriptional regulator [uncultured Oscillibacter sp.]|uniref:LysR family transcriptional regulator n=1 Tax=uncultured Oscillibacter sp. TaxID=876091 RepID=UPI0025E7BE11|nr:LysR family transcriptional regulator [uncultured Oscillibacter sp.]